MILDSTVFSLHINICCWVILDLQSHLNIFNLRNIVSVEIVQEMRLAIFGSDQTSENLMFDLSETCICHGGSLFIFTSEQHIPKKIASSCTEGRYADLTEQCNNMGLKTFRKVLFLVSNFFSI